ncbi:leucine-rich repeat-containing protein 51 isoform X1 [Tympanuchus pallidicinctus]|uniref:leucine-rich repeat-containing protein 51 isoform X1 n=2 Tax=Tympanuchus pallidicinctus TaxID=109042 RepID=UPI00228759C7|nr:leucine-rich repeat-containing protein 51 isoform X1 [Tympanuchus pallidicinctus]
MCGVMGARVGLEAVLGPRDTCEDKLGTSGPLSNGAGPCPTAMPTRLLPPELVPPLDFSFFPLQSLQDLSPKGSPSPTLALRLPYTGLSSLEGLHLTLQQLLADPTQLRWLDLSFNCLTTIDQVLSTLGGLQSLYLHGNTISCLREVDKLGALSQLRRLTLYGNPMEEEGGYRHYVLAMLPQLSTLDFSAVTPQERREVAVWGGTQRRPRPHRASE